MSTHSAIESDAYPYPTTTASGARLRSIRAFSAFTFFSQFALPVDVSRRHVDAWGAFEDCNSLIGAAALTPVSDSTFWAQIAVAPERRRLGIGGELLTVMIREAGVGGGRRLIGSYPAQAIEPRLLVESLQLVASRRVGHEQANAVLCIEVPSILAQESPASY
jgi:GNAT superfamily N-acetyltransferase